MHLLQDIVKDNAVRMIAESERAKCDEEYIRKQWVFSSEGKVL